MRKRLIFVTFAALAVVALFVAACGDDDDDNGGGSTPTATGVASGTGSAPEPLDVTITAQDFSFDKAAISAAPGQKVNITLKNDGNAEHSFTVGTTDVTEAEGGEEGTGDFTASASTTEFHCKYHSQMKGTITVDASSANISPTETTSGSGIGGYGY